MKLWIALLLFMQPFSAICAELNLSSMNFRELSKLSHKNIFCLEYSLEQPIEITKKNARIGALSTLSKASTITVMHSIKNNIITIDGNEQIELTVDTPIKVHYYLFRNIGVCAALEKI